MSRFSKAEIAANKAKALETLREYLKPGSKVYVQVASMSRSGMSRDLRLFVVHEGDLLNITWDACFATGNIPRDSKYGERVWRIGGCGMDMAFAAVYELSSALFAKEDMPWKECQRCHKGEETVSEYNEAHDTDPTQPRYTQRTQVCRHCNGKVQTQESPGYALKKETL
jgi:hypothetical protein